MIGPGKYDAEATEMILRLKAAGVLLLVFSGERGSGFSVSLDMRRGVNCFLDLRPRTVPATPICQPAVTCCRCGQITVWPVYYRAEPGSFPFCAHPARPMAS